MAKTTKSPGKVLQSWVTPEFAEQVKQHANLECRPVSELIRVALRDRLTYATSSPLAGKTTAPGDRNQEPLRATSPVAGADNQEEG